MFNLHLLRLDTATHTGVHYTQNTVDLMLFNLHLLLTKTTGALSAEWVLLPDREWVPFGHMAEVAVVLPHGFLRAHERVPAAAPPTRA